MQVTADSVGDHHTDLANMKAALLKDGKLLGKHDAHKAVDGDQCENLE